MLIRSLADVHLGGVHFEAIVNDAAVKFMAEFLCEHVFSFVLERCRQKEGPDHAPGTLSHLSEVSSCCLVQKLL